MQALGYILCLHPVRLQVQVSLKTMGAILGQVLWWERYKSGVTILNFVIWTRDKFDLCELQFSYVLCEMKKGTRIK